MAVIFRNLRSVIFSKGWKVIWKVKNKFLFKINTKRLKCCLPRHTNIMLNLNQNVFPVYLYMFLIVLSIFVATADSIVFKHPYLKLFWYWYCFLFLFTIYWFGCTIAILSKSSTIFFYLSMGIDNVPGKQE